jgi:hypothetical protein
MFNELFDEAKALLRSRKRAYDFTFNLDSVDVQIVLKDLAEFCRANETTFNPDPRVHALVEGRKEVWLRIQKYLNLTPDQLWELYRKD